MKPGVTLIELLLVISMVAILAVSSTPFISATLTRYHALTAQDRLLGALRKAQNYSAEHRLGQEWGVCITGGQLRLYGGSCTSPLQQENWDIPGSVSITGFTDLPFSNYRGEPPSAATIGVDSGVEQGTITVYKNGGIDVN